MNIQKHLIILILLVLAIPSNSQSFIDDYSNLNDNNFKNFLVDWQSWSLHENKTNRLYKYRFTQLLDSTDKNSRLRILPQEVKVYYYNDTVSLSNNIPLKVDSILVAYEDCDTSFVYFNALIKNVLDKFLYTDNKKINTDNLKKALRLIKITYLDWTEELNIESIRYYSYPFIYRIDMFSNWKLVYCQTRWNQYKIFQLDKDEYDISKGLVVEEWYED